MKLFFVHRPFFELPPLQGRGKRQLFPQKFPCRPSCSLNAPYSFDLRMQKQFADSPSAPCHLPEILDCQCLSRSQLKLQCLRFLSSFTFPRDHHRCFALISAALRRFPSVCASSETLDVCFRCPRRFRNGDVAILVTPRRAIRASAACSKGQEQKKMSVAPKLAAAVSRVQNLVAVAPAPLLRDCRAMS